MEINQTNLDQLPEDEVPVEISSNLGFIDSEEVADITKGYDNLNRNQLEENVVDTLRLL